MKENCSVCAGKFTDSENKLTCAVEIVFYLTFADTS
jgi:hypothetical protein